MEINLNDRVKINKSKGFELPKVVEIRVHDVVLQRSKKKGTIAIPKNRFERMNKTFRGAQYSYTTAINI